MQWLLNHTGNAARINETSSPRKSSTEKYSAIKQAEPGVSAMINVSNQFPEWPKRKLLPAEKYLISIPEYLMP